MGFGALLKRWHMCIIVGGGYAENYTFFVKVRISHVLRFISICDLFTDSPSYMCVLMYKIQFHLKREHLAYLLTKINFLMTLK
jgi:hypothetical protein